MGRFQTKELWEWLRAFRGRLDLDLTDFLLQAHLRQDWVSRLFSMAVPGCLDPRTPKVF